jgi:hypothetical protein
LPLDKLIQQSGGEQNSGTSRATNGELAPQPAVPAVPRAAPDEGRGRAAARTRERESGR